MAARIAEAHERSSGALLHEIEAHSAAFAGNLERTKAEVRAAIAAHRDAINLLVAALPDRLEQEAARRDQMNPVTQTTTPTHER